MTYDLIVIGGGPAGYLGAERAAQAGLKTMVIEKQYIGGVCLNVGCIPSKTLLYSAKLYDGVKYGDKYGVSASGLELNHAAIVDRKNKVVKALTGGVRTQLKKAGVTIVEGMAQIDGRASDGYAVRVGNDVYTATRLLIATGSVPAVPPIKGLDAGLKSGFVVTSNEIFDLEAIPSSLVVIGGGVIGLEMASYFNSAGSKVTVVELLDRIGGNIDSEIAGLLQEEYSQKGVEFRLSSRVVEIADRSVICESNGERITIQADKVLLSVGRKPVVDGFGLETIGVEVEKGHIKVDEQGRTNVPRVYAAGDVNGRSMLAHTAYREAEVCVNHMTGRKDKVAYDSIPLVIYTNPEVAAAGETEESARAKGIDFDTVNLSMRFSGRYLAENQGGRGICKVLVEKSSRRIIGVHMIANYASEIIYGAGMMIDRAMTVEDIRRTVFPHPTVSEIIRECVWEIS